MIEIMTRQRVSLFIALFGLLLILNAVSVTITDAGSREMYKYESKEVTYNESEGLTIGGSSGNIHPMDEDVACLRGEVTPECHLASSVYKGLDLTASELLGSESFTQTNYVYLGIADHKFFKWSVNDTGYIELQEVEAQKVFQSTSVPFSSASKEARRAVKTGEVTTNEKPAETDQLIENDGRYYVLSQVAYDSSWDMGMFYGVLDALGFVAGIGLLLYGYTDFRHPPGRNE